MKEQTNPDIANGYKMTELGPLPQEWEVVRLGEVAEFETGKRMKGGALEKGEVLSIGGEHIDDFGNIILEKPKFITKEFYNSLKKGKLKKNDVIICKDGAKTGKVAYVRELYDHIAVNEHVFIIRAKNCHVKNSFIFFFLFSKFGQSQIRKAYHGLIGGITNNDVFNIHILLPPLSEQCKIAAILSMVQKAIETEKALIERTKELKKSMMHKLFTEGIGWLSGAETSQKQTEIGPIPENWEVVRLGEEIVDIIMGQSPPGETYNTDGNGFPFLQGKAEFGYKHPKNIKYTTKPQKIAPKNSILLSVRAPVGDVNIADKEYCIGRGLAAINGKQGNNYFIFYYLLYNKNNIERLGSGSTFKSINKSQIENLKIPLPPLSEQQAIANILSTIDQKIEHHTTKKQKLEELFRNLLHELMTARVRVDKINLEFLKMEDEI